MALVKEDKPRYTDYLAPRSQARDRKAKHATRNRIAWALVVVLTGAALGVGGGRVYSAVATYRATVDALEQETLALRGLLLGDIEASFVKEYNDRQAEAAEAEAPDVNP